ANESACTCRKNLPLHKLWSRNLTFLFQIPFLIMRKIAMIPARYAATPFPYKIEQLLDDRSIIRHTYRNAVSNGLFDEVMVVTDSAVIMEEIEKEDGKVIKSLHEHESGSDRIAEAVEMIEVDVVVNVQGDEPFVQREPLEQLLALFKDPEVQ